MRLESGLALACVVLAIVPARADGQWRAPACTGCTPRCAPDPAGIAVGPGNAELAIGATATADPVGAAGADRLADTRGPAHATTADRPCTGTAVNAVGRVAGSVRADGSGTGPLSIAKWATLAAASGSGAYGLWAQHEADRGYERVAQICADEPNRCDGTGASAASAGYADPAVERMHDRASTLEDRALYSLIGSQLGLIASTLLFILDMRESGTPPNEIYQPDTVRVVPRGGGGAELRIRLAPPW